MNTKRALSILRAELKKARNNGDLNEELVILQRIDEWKHANVK